jgi:hypothetical protein
MYVLELRKEGDYIDPVVRILQLVRFSLLVVLPLMLTIFLARAASQKVSVPMP